MLLKAHHHHRHLMMVKLLTMAVIMAQAQDATVPVIMVDAVPMATVMDHTPSVTATALVTVIATAAVQEVRHHNHHTQLPSI